MAERKPLGYWNNIQNIKMVARKCSTRTEFQKKYAGAYDAASRHGVLDEVCAHMMVTKNLSKRAIYAIEFDDMSVYVGLTWSYKKRKRSRERAKDRIWEKQQQTKHRIIEFDEWYSPPEAQKQEGKIIDYYRAEGWDILNKANAGALGGGPSRYTKSAVKKCALNCETRTEFLRKYSRAYEVARKKNWLNEVCQHMKHIKHSNGHWTFENCKKVAIKCNSRSEFERLHLGAYTKARRMGWLDEICSHMISNRMPNGYWTQTKIRNVAKQCASIEEFRSLYPRAYNLSRKSGIWDEISLRMHRSVRPNGYWNRARVTAEALNYKRKIDFFRNSGSAYNAAKKLGIFEEICRHML